MRLVDEERGAHHLIEVVDSSRRCPGRRSRRHPPVRGRGDAGADLAVESGMRRARRRCAMIAICGRSSARTARQACGRPRPAGRSNSIGRSRSAGDHTRLVDAFEQCMCTGTSSSAPSARACWMNSAEQEKVVEAHQPGDQPAAFPAGTDEVGVSCRPSCPFSLLTRFGRLEREHGADTAPHYFGLRIQASRQRIGRLGAVVDRGHTAAQHLQQDGVGRGADFRDPGDPLPAATRNLPGKARSRTAPCRAAGRGPAGRRDACSVDKSRASVQPGVSTISSAGSVGAASSLGDESSIRVAVHARPTARGRLAGWSIRKSGRMSIKRRPRQPGAIVRHARCHRPPECVFLRHPAGCGYSSVGKRQPPILPAGRFTTKLEQNQHGDRFSILVTITGFLRRLSKALNWAFTRQRRPIFYSSYLHPQKAGWR